MPKWLQQMVWPTLMLWFYAVGYGIASAINSFDAELSNRGELAARLALPLVISSWVLADARKRGRELCHDYGAFVFFAWPLVVPVYLFQTRGARALLTLLCFVGIWVVGIVLSRLIGA